MIVGDGTEMRTAHGLVVTVGSRACFLPLSHVLETMRPLPVEPLPGMPSFVTGLAVVRGAPVPVVDLARATGSVDHDSSTRFVLLDVDGRRVALSVARVVGIRALDPDQISKMPPLLSGPDTEVLGAVGTLDAGLLLVLRATRLIPPEAWEVFGHRGAAT